ncbi:tripartite motif-containing protein 45 [Condylostylus longicornis]|uniref:tripartite motif-containing protein 45 n=1 Tax=Condylostylus longicornis TaxID=2530218 RepID=UPI00244DD242|nr:tripartite motif-containing protein 45 [Condylostylus longicornis]
MESDFYNLNSVKTSSSENDFETCNNSSDIDIEHSEIDNYIKPQFQEKLPNQNYQLYKNHKNSKINMGPLGNSIEPAKLSKEDNEKFENIFQNFLRKKTLSMQQHKIQQDQLQSRLDSNENGQQKNNDDKNNLPEIVLTSVDNTPESSSNEPSSSSKKDSTSSPSSKSNSDVIENSTLQTADYDFYNGLTAVMAAELNFERKLSSSSSATSDRSRNSRRSSISNTTATTVKAMDSSRNFNNIQFSNISSLQCNNEITNNNNSNNINRENLNQSENLPPKELIEQHIPPFLKCHICRQMFKDPRTLFCLHSFCFQCLVNENYSQDASIPFWSHPSDQSKTSSEWNNAQSNFNGSSLKSTSFMSGAIESEYDGSKYRSHDSRHSHNNTKINRKSTKEKSTKGQSNKHGTERAQYIVCSICQFCTEIPIGGIRNLPQNFILSRKIEEILLQIGHDTISNIWCSLCYDEMPATYHCLNCITNLCSFCKEAHERQKSTASHTIQNLLDLRKTSKEKSPMDVAKFNIMCSLHPGFELKFFCGNCQQLICSDCSALLHKNHKIDPGLKVIKLCTKLLKDTADKTKPLCEYTDQSISKLAGISRRINERCNQVQNDVDNFMAAYFEALEVHRRTLLQQIAKARETKMQMILEQQIEMEKRSSEAKAAVEFCQELLDKGTYGEILSFMNILMKRLDFCQKYKPPLDTKISDSLHFLCDIRAPSTKAQNDIPLYGIITTQTVEPQFCTIESEGHSNLRVHKQVDLVLLSRDSDAVPLCHGGLTIDVQLKYKDNPSKLLEVQISDKRDGTYVISFVPEYAGLMILSIMIKNKPIKDSPFTLHARTLRPHSGIFHCCTFCSSKGSKTATCACGGVMNGGYKGCGHGHTGHPGRRHWSCCANTVENSECTTANQF